MSEDEQQQAQPEEAPKEHRRLRDRFTPRRVSPREIGEWVRSLNFSTFSLTMVFVIVFSVFAVAPQVTILLDQRNRIVELEAAVAESSKRVEAIEAQRDRWKDPAFIRAQARDRLFFVLPGETQLSVIEDVDIPESFQSKVTSTLQKSSRNWLQQLASSTLLAGVTDALPPSSEDAQ